MNNVTPMSKQIRTPQEKGMLEEVDEYRAQLEANDPELLRRMDEKAKSVALAVSSQMAPPGALNLAPLLERRRLDYGIVDAVFNDQPAFDRVFLYQISDQLDHEHYEGSSLVLSQSEQNARMKEAPRAVLVAAGLSAQDYLYGHGIELGHIVKFMHNHPWRVRVAQVLGRDINVMPMRAQDILSSEDLAVKMRSGECNIRLTDGVHSYCFSDEKTARYKEEVTGQPALD
jgi:hypothetical protein